jgi:hypothetical protein
MKQGGGGAPQDALNPAGGPLEIRVTSDADTHIAR